MKELTLDIYIISRCTHTFYARELKKIHVTMGQFMFIMAVAQNDGISQEKLSANMKISKSTTAMIMQQLLNGGLVTREIDENDRRNFKLHPTDKALELLPKIQEIIDRCHRTITGDLTDIERNVFVELLRKVRLRTEADLGRTKARKSKKS